MTEQDIKVKISFTLSKDDIPEEIANRLDRINMRKLHIAQLNLTEVVKRIELKGDIDPTSIEYFSTSLNLVEQALEQLYSCQDIFKGLEELKVQLAQEKVFIKTNE